MKKTKCISVRLKSLVSISDKAYKAIAYDGSEAILPKSQVFCEDHEVSKSQAYWIAEWILLQKQLQYSHKKKGWYNPYTGVVESEIIVEKHIPEKIEPVATQPHKDLLR